MKPSIRIHVEHVESGSKRSTLYLDFKDIPAGMTPKRCAVWMLSKSIEQLREDEPRTVQVGD